MQNSMVAKHSIDVGHRIDWDNTKLVFHSNHVGKRRVVEGALINLANTFDNNKAFTQEDKFTNLLVCKTARIDLTDFNSTPSAQVSSLSLTQALDVEDRSLTNSNAGTDADPSSSTINHPASTTTATTVPPRRSSRIAQRNHQSTGIT